MLNWGDLCLGKKKKKKGALVRFPGFSVTPKTTMLITNTKEHREKRGCSSLTERIKPQASLCKRWGNRMHLPCGFILVNFWHRRMLTLTRQFWKTKVKPSKGIHWTDTAQEQAVVICLPDSNSTICAQDLLGHFKDFKCYGGENNVNVIFSEHWWRANQTERVSNNSKR